MFQFFFKYPGPVFSRGRLVLLSAWPAWLLPVLILAAAAFIAWLLRRPRGEAAPALGNWRTLVVWAMQSALVGIILVLLWQPAMTVGELNSQQNIIAVVLDDSRSMSLPDRGAASRESSAIAALEKNILPGLQQRFQTRMYTLGEALTQVPSPHGIAPLEPATHLDSGLKQLADETSELPVGAVLLLTDGGQNGAELGRSEISPEVIQELRNRRLPVHTVGFGNPEAGHDLEIEDVSLASGAVANARVTATITLKQYGYLGQKATLSVRDGEKTLAQREVDLQPDGRLQTEPLSFSAGAAGAKRLTFGIAPLAGEENQANNAMTRPFLVSDARRRILYIEGEPRWEYKFIRRAEDGDPTVQIVSMLRTSENKIYRQGISSPDELSQGFPSRAEDLFAYTGIIVGSVAADYFTPVQQELLREFVDRRGGGILFLGGSSALSDGGWAASSLGDLLPTFLPQGNHNFHRNAATVELTPAGLDSPITRLLDDPEKNGERWKKLAYLADFEDPGTPKPGATELVDMHAGRRKLPLLVTQNYGHGRTAILATGGTWRWQMSEALGDPSHDLFWQQLLRWLVGETPGPVTASMPARLLQDEGRVRLIAQVRNRDFQPAADARVTAHIVGPANSDSVIDLTPSPDTQGQYQADWTAEKPGAYLAEVVAQSSGTPPQELGRDVVTFQREDGIAENFHTAQNRQLLQHLSAATGGRYWNPSDLKNLPREISYSDAGISARTTKELWDMPIVFMLLLGLPLGEWLLRRKWGVL
ncbi:hypothetical protein DYQ86_20770 [Acidobacteria bacterium AB60]|nr:hypothetical protein DYQ86_20770 [Acidobacteria bacterium AB60]